MTITSEQIIGIAGLIGAIAVIWGVVSKPFKAVKEIKESVDKLTESMDKFGKTQQMQGDMVYQLLDHAATNNNTGEMQRALQQYNAYFRHE